MSQLTPIAHGVWSMARSLRFWGVDTGARMTIVRLRNGELFVHSPLALDAALQVEVDALGRVGAVVAPSLFHHLSVTEWRQIYPSAVFACCPGLQEKRADFAWDRILSDVPEAEWAADLDQIAFTARKLESEVVFFHGATRTMICADAIFNLSQHEKRLTRLAALLLWNRRPGATWLEHVMIRDRASARQQVDRMLAWNPERILLAHGKCIEHDAEKVLRDAYAWL